MNEVAAPAGCTTLRPISSTGSCRWSLTRDLFYEVFVSYSHDTPEHITAVLDLSNRLRGEGIDCVLDQYEASPPEGWPRWMVAKIRSCRYVVMICTEAYNRRVMGTESDGVGHGVRWEGSLIYQHIYDAGSLNVKFIPVVLREADRSHVPTPVRGATVYSLEAKDGYKRLYERLAEIPPSMPALGPRRPLPERPVKTNPAMFVTGPIDVDLWNRAKWKATFYTEAPDGLPVLGLAFKDGEAAAAIFRGWHLRYGERDESEELRIAIIEGDIPGDEAGYSVHVNVDTDVFIQRLKSAGFSYDNDLIITVGRVNRMNPAPGSPFLSQFKELYRRKKTYWLVPGVIDEREQVRMMPGLRIFKGKVLFKHVSELHSKDIDSVVLAKEGELHRKGTA